MESKTTNANAREAVRSNRVNGDDVYNPKSGKVRGTVWKNFSQRTGKHYYKVSIRRSETDEGGVEH